MPPATCSAAGRRRAATGELRWPLDGARAAPARDERPGVFAAGDVRAGAANASRGASATAPGRCASRTTCSTCSDERYEVPPADQGRGGEDDGDDEEAKPRPRPVARAARSRGQAMAQARRARWSERGSRARRASAPDGPAQQERRRYLQRAAERAALVVRAAADRREQQDRRRRGRRRARRGARRHRSRGHPGGGAVYPWRQRRPEERMSAHSPSPSSPLPDRQCVGGRPPRRARARVRRPPRGQAWTAHVPMYGCTAFGEFGVDPAAPRSCSATSARAAPYARLHVNQRRAPQHYPSGTLPRRRAAAARRDVEGRPS